MTRLDDPELAHPAKQAVHRVVREMIDRAGSDLVAVLGFGRLYRLPPPVQSTDLLVVLREAGIPQLRAVGGLLHQLGQEQDAHFLILTEEEVAAAADVFAVRFHLMQRRHWLLHGTDVVAGLRIAPENLRLRTEQELRNLQIRLRRRIVGAAGDAVEAQRILLRNAVPLADALECLGHLQGEDIPVSFRAREILARRAEADPAGPWAGYAELVGTGVTGGAIPLLERLLPALDRVVDEADRLVTVA